MILDILRIVAPPAAIALLGWAWVRAGRPWDGRIVAAFVIGIGSPALAFHTLATMTLALSSVAITAALYAGTMLLAALAGTALLKALGRPVAAYLPTLMFPNAGNLGLPIMLFAFGQEGLALGIVCVVIGMTGHFTIGVALASGRVDLKAVATSPPLYGLAAGLATYLAGWVPPAPVMATAELLGGLAIPLSLLALGGAMAHLPLADARVGAGLGLARLGLGIAAGALLIWVVEAPPLVEAVVLLQAAMPSAVFNHMFAERYGGPAREVAGGVLVSTLGSLVTIPVLLAVLLAD